MNISKFLLLDAVLLIALMPLVFLVQVKNKKLFLFHNLNKEEKKLNTLNNLPSKQELLALEKIAISQGSGIDYDLIVGNWKFLSVWNNDVDDKESIFSSLLRLFSANIEIREEISQDNLPKYFIITSIQFGLFSIEFSGSAYLKGKQPFLFFFFNLIEVKLDSSVLLKRSIKEAIEKEKSFFGLIATKGNCGWLSARGQGGALILWVKD